MKRILSALLCLAVLLFAAAAPAEEPEGNGFQWGAYELKATWVTTDNAKINLVNMREDGLFVMVRLAGVGTPVYADDVKAIQEGEFVLVDAAGKEYGISTWIMRKLIQPEGGGFPTMAEEQEFFDILFSTWTGFPGNSPRRNKARRTGSRNAPPRRTEQPGRSTAAITAS